eukprot:m.259553 g.259553  ORF g.259553 m.259553 type:complete len:66 (+) comp15555_c0_seq1:102-299(+)
MTHGVLFLTFFSLNSWSRQTAFQTYYDGESTYHCGGRGWVRFTQATSDTRPADARTQHACMCRQF